MTSCLRIHNIEHTCTSPCSTLSGAFVLSTSSKKAEPRHQGASVQLFVNGPYVTLIRMLTDLPAKAALIAAEPLATAVTAPWSTETALSLDVVHTANPETSIVLPFSYSAINLSVPLSPVFMENDLVFIVSFFSLGTTEILT